jgi:hypothetical protein
MNTRLATRFVSFALSALFTLAILGSVDLLATSQPPAGLLAQMAHSVPQV